MLAALGAAAGAFVVVGGSGAGAPAVHHHRPKPAPATFAGPDGVESRAIIAENARPGTNSWQITAEPPTGFIEGFAATTSARPGESVALYVSTSAASFRVVAFRMGWYGGSGGREVWQSRPLRGVDQPPCPLTPGINMVSCDNWHRSLSVRLTRAFVPGDYLLKLVASGGQQAYVLLTIWSPASRSTYVLIARSMTEEGWNTFGGYDFYQGLGSCAPTYPPCNRARVVSFDRPYAAEHGAADFLANELPLVELVERDGLDVSYVTDVTVSAHPWLLERHKAILSLAHDETWTASELTGLRRALAHGVNVAFFSAAAIVRHARLQASVLGPNREVVDYRDAAADPLAGKASPLAVTGNTWASPPTDIAVSAITGELYSGFVDPGAAPVPFVVYDAHAFVFKGTGLHDGTPIPGVIASDIDHVAPAYPMPADLQVLGHSPVPLSVAYTNQGEWNGVTYSDMTYYTEPGSKAGVLDTGTVNWIDALSPCAPGTRRCAAPLVARITENVLALFGRGPAGRFVPSVPNWRRVMPAGS